MLTSSSLSPEWIPDETEYLIYLMMQKKSFKKKVKRDTITLGFILLILSSASRWWSIFAAIEWFLGISAVVAAYKGLYVILHHSHACNLQP
jgi:hypothetical protein